MKIAFLGPKATFTDVAVRGMFPDDIAVPYMTIPDCIDAVINGEAHLCVVPLENALEGSVNITIDYLVHETTQLPVIGEITAPIQQHLLVHPDHLDHWEKIETVYSHPHAMAQCHKFLHKHFKNAARVHMTSTAAAAKYVHEHPEEKAAAIANELAAREYGLAIAKRNIHDLDFNHTRFIILSKSAMDLSGYSLPVQRYKTTLMVTLPDDRSGALHQVLSAFAWRKLNLSKIESRPTKTGLGNYFFIIDVDMKMDEVLIPGAIAELEALGCTVKVLGSYPSFQIKES